MKPKLLAFLLFPLIGFSQQHNSKTTDSLKTSNIFNLGEVIITNHQSKDSLNRITSKAMESQKKMEVSKALNMLPGVSLTASGPRNESMVSVRGLDAGLNNIFDRNYSLVEGYPEEGRIFL